MKKTINKKKIVKKIMPFTDPTLTPMKMNANNRLNMPEK